MSDGSPEGKRTGHPRKRAGLELGAAMLTAAAHLLTNRFGGHGVFVVVAVAGWLAYCVVASRAVPRAPAAWGLRVQGARDTWRATTVPALAVLAASVGIGMYLGNWPPPPYAALLALLYPVWGIVQQLLVQGFVVRHVDDRLQGRHRWATSLLGASAFGAVHLPHIDLAAATFAFGLFATPVWLRYRNLLPLAVWHGVLGVAFYYLVLGRDPWLENFG